MATMREIMTENTPVCRAQYSLNHGGPWDCVLPENHAGPHRDGDHDTWDITYRDPEPGVSQQPIPVDIRVRPVQDQLTDLAARVGLLEVAWAPGGETLSERLDRVMLGLMEEIRRVSGPDRSRAVLIDPEELSGLLKDREELHTLRNAAQSDVATEKAVERGDMLSVSRTAWEQRGEDSDKLSALEQAGVDNWEGYSHAMSIYRGDEEG